MQIPYLIVQDSSMHIITKEKSVSVIFDKFTFAYILIF